MRRQRLAKLGLAVAFCAAAPVAAQVEFPGTDARINVAYSEPADAGLAERLRDIAIRVKPTADQLEALEQIDIVVVHSPRELGERLGEPETHALTGISYLHGILFLSPLSWPGNATPEALEHEMQEALVRYAALRLAGGNPLPDWLDQGLVAVLTKRPFAPATAERVSRRAALLLNQMQADDPAVGYWAVRYLVEARGGLTPLRQLIRFYAQRPDSFVEELQLVYAVSVAELERDWRRWLVEVAAKEKPELPPGPREGPLVKDRL